MKKYYCDECGILLQPAEVIIVVDKDGKHHEVCVDCAVEKYEEERDIV